MGVLLVWELTASQVEHRPILTSTFLTARGRANALRSGIGHRTPKYRSAGHGISSAIAT